MGKTTKAGAGKKSRLTDAAKARMLRMVLDTAQDYATIGAKFGVSSGTVFYHIGGRKAALARQQGR